MAPIWPPVQRMPLLDKLAGAQQAGGAREHHRVHLLTNACHAYLRLARRPDSAVRCLHPELSRPYMPVGCVGWTHVAARPSVYHPPRSSSCLRRLAACRRRMVPRQLSAITPSLCRSAARCATTQHALRSGAGRGAHRAHCRKPSPGRYPCAQRHCVRGAPPLYFFASRRLAARRPSPASAPTCPSGCVA